MINKYKIKAKIRKHFDFFMPIWFGFKNIITKFGNIQKLTKSKTKLTKLKNIHLNKRCFMIGNGPSLSVADLEKLNDEITFGVNRIYKIFNSTSWRPTYYCIADKALLLNSSNEVNKLMPKVKFIGISMLNNPNIKNATYFRLVDRNYYPKYPKVSSNICKGIYSAPTVTYACLQIAFYMGFKEIYLLGVDHNYSVSLRADGTIEHNDVKDHFSETDTIANLPQLDKSTLAYQAAKKYADSHGIKIYNATRGGKLEVFERVDFDSLFPEDSKK